MVFMKPLLLSFKETGVFLCVLLILKFLDMENILYTSGIFTETHWCFMLLVEFLLFLFVKPE